METGRVKKVLSGAEAFVREQPWIAIKFCLLFVVIGLFASYNFGIETGLPLSAVITILAMAQWRIFDKASDAFFDITAEDDTGRKTERVAVTIAKRIFWTFFDYGLAALSVLLVVTARKYDYSFLTAVAAMWFIIDMPSASVFVTIYEKTGNDMTLGRAYRRMANTIYEHSKIAGAIVFLYEITLASFWSGPDYTVLFFRDELKNRIGVALAVVLITAFHATLWTAVYWLGYDNAVELIAWLKG